MSKVKKAKDVVKKYKDIDKAIAKLQNDILEMLPKEKKDKGGTSPLELRNIGFNLCLALITDVIKSYFSEEGD